MLSNADGYLKAGLLGDLTIGCGDWTNHQEAGIELDNWLGFIRKVINKYGFHLASLQITNEPNLSFMEGSKPYIMQALIEGVITAKKETQKSGLPIKIGFGSVPESPAAVPHFWENISKAGRKTFIDSMDFVGHNFYADVFEEQPLDLSDIPALVPIRITENGWPTGKNPITNIERPYEHQAKVLEAVVQTIYDLRQELNISHFELFGLRDADSSKDDLFHQYGIMRDDYTPKPAYHTFKKLIQELGI